MFRFTYTFPFRAHVTGKRWEGVDGVSEIVDGVPDCLQQENRRYCCYFRCCCLGFDHFSLEYLPLAALLELWDF
ncbi:hypothetical protein R1flu_029128 [Riccia fluitans]|uniref:Uncharacterized protein n=1 Tax=Riccia fluitans TaxID=41844 RepID=A0ABD1XP78_9MARC